MQMQESIVVHFRSCWHSFQMPFEVFTLAHFAKTHRNQNRSLGLTKNKAVKIFEKKSANLLPSDDGEETSDCERESRDDDDDFRFAKQT